MVFDFWHTETGSSRNKIQHVIIICLAAKIFEITFSVIFTSRYHVLAHCALCVPVLCMFHVIISLDYLFFFIQFIMYTYILNTEYQGPGAFQFILFFHCSFDGISNFFNLNFTFWIFKYLICFNSVRLFIVILFSVLLTLLCARWTLNMFKFNLTVCFLLESCTGSDVKFYEMESNWIIHEMWESGVGVVCPFFHSNFMCIQCYERWRE